MNSFTYALEQRNLEELRKYPRQTCTIILCLVEIECLYIRKLVKKLSH